MKWYRTADHNELVNLETVENIFLVSNSIKFYFSGEGLYVQEIFETKEKAEKWFNKIAEKLGTDNFSN